jgi:dihydropteroate synthase
LDADFPDDRETDLNEPGTLLTGARRQVSLYPPAIMGVVNVTPDSFSNDGLYDRPEEARDRALGMVKDGATIIDIGGESTRPGARNVSVAEEIDRLLLVVATLRAESDVFISVDTSNPETIREVCAAGADMINDIRALERPGALDAVAAAGAAACVMHMQGDPKTMQNAPHYDDVVAEVRGYLEQRVNACLQAGLTPGQIVIDPGFGFGKTLDHNLTLLRALAEMNAGGRPVLVGVSRKAMFKRLFEVDDMASRINGSLGAAFWATLRGAGIIRTHDVCQTVQMVRLAGCLLD